MARNPMSPTDAANKWASRVSSSGGYYKAGVSRPDVDWQGATLAAGARRDAALQAAIADGRIQRGIQNTPNSKWQQAASTIGAQNWQSKTPLAKDKFQQGLQKSYGYMDAARAAISGMPNITTDDRINRAAEWQRVMHAQAEAAKRG